MKHLELMKINVDDLILEPLSKDNYQLLVSFPQKYSRGNVTNHIDNLEFWSKTLRYNGFRWGYWLIYRQEDLIGYIGFTNLNLEIRSAEIMYQVTEASTQELYSLIVLVDNYLRNNLRFYSVETMINDHNLLKLLLNFNFTVYNKNKEFIHLIK